MVKSYLLSYAPGVRLQPRAPHISPFPPPNKKPQGQRFLLKRHSPLYLPLSEEPKNSAKELLEIPATETAIRTEKGFDQLLDKDQKEDKKIQDINDKGFEEAAKKYLEEKESDQDKSEVQTDFSPPPNAIRAETATIAAAAATKKKTTRKPKKIRKRTVKKKSKKSSKKERKSIKAKFNNFRIQ